MTGVVADEAMPPDSLSRETIETTIETEGTTRPVSES
jgi:hypothetical protein